MTTRRDVADILAHPTAPTLLVLNTYDHGPSLFRRGLHLRGLRVRLGILPAGCEPYNSTQHEADHCKNDETDVATREVLVIFDNAPAAAEPAIRALNYPAFG